MKKQHIILTTTLLMAVEPIGFLQAAELYVSPTGNDVNPAAKSKPYASLPAGRNFTSQANSSTLLLDIEPFDVSKMGLQKRHQQ